MFESINAGKDNCIISEKIKNRINPNLLENQELLNDNDFYVDDALQNSALITYVDILFTDDSSIMCVLDKITFKNNNITVNLTIPPIKSEIFLSLENNFKKINVIDSGNSAIATYQISKLIKKTIKFNDNKYIEAKLKFRK